LKPDRGYITCDHPKVERIYHVAGNPLKKMIVMKEGHTFSEIIPVVMEFYKEDK
jgi:hypothetical protein